MNYAIFAKDSYNTDIANKPSPAPGYQIDRELSNNNVSIYVNSKKREVVMAVRGTDFSNRKDLKQDILVIANILNFSTRLANMKRKLKAIESKYPNYGIVLSSHSLGGSINQELVMSIKPKRLKASYSYNPGTSPLMIKTILADQLSCLVYPKWCKNIKRRNFIFVVQTDPISTVSQLKGLLATVYPTRPKFPANPHTIDNFL